MAGTIDHVTGEQMYKLAERLFPICRSITGEGVRQTLQILQEDIPLEIREIPTGTPVFDWTIPREWNVKDAWVKDPSGQKIIDFKKNNLHLLNYSIPYRGKMALAQLKDHLYYMPEKPDLIPYRTSYYTEKWGFCLAYDQFKTLPEGAYEVLIDSSLSDGHLTYGELHIPGDLEEEFLLTTHICHPSLANDNLSGIVVLQALAKYLLSIKNRYSYRILFIPGTIGSITWLALNEGKISRIKGGLVASLLGDRAQFHFKRSRIGDSDLDRLVEYVLTNSEYPYTVMDFIPYGYDERQFCSPGINLPMGNLTRSTFGYPEYHTSADNLQFISANELEKSYLIYRAVVRHWEMNRKFVNLIPKGEPQLGKRGLYEAIGGKSDSHTIQMAILWVLNLSDGHHSMLDIAIRSGISMAQLHQVSELLISKSLLSEI